MIFVYYVDYWIIILNILLLNKWNHKLKEETTLNFFWSYWNSETDYSKKTKHKNELKQKDKTLLLPTEVVQSEENQKKRGKNAL